MELGHLLTRSGLIVLCGITGLIPINIKIEETAKYYECIKVNGNQFKREMDIKHWIHPVNSVKITEGQGDSKHAIHVYTDGSKSEHGVGAGIAIFTGSNIIDTKKYRLDWRSSNNPAEQLAILKALVNVRNLETNLRIVLVSTDSRITLKSLKNWKNHTYLIEKIRMKVTNGEAELGNRFNWIKALAGHRGNELADQLVEEAANKRGINECYTRIPKSTVLSELNDHSVTKWQSEWDHTTKGTIMKSFFLKIADSLKRNLNVTPNFTIMITVHGNIKSYLHKYKILDSPVCSCKTREQTVDHILFDCKLLEQERDSLK
jgi:ribonuclease HI